jgi:2-dehydro-3-deoxyphosphooctonate aldolase (KDO 8-P synthase)
MLREIGTRLRLPVLTDIHTPEMVPTVARAVDMLQIPAFLCRQTDLIVAAARSGTPVNIKKGQFMAPWEMKNVVGKAREGGATEILLTERGTSFGYNNLVTDFRSIPIMQQTGCPVVFDATHSVQLPGGQGDASGGQREYAPLLARAAVAAGCNGLFFEVYPDPDKALCDGPNALALCQMKPLLETLLEIHRIIRSTH